MIIPNSKSLPLQSFIIIGICHNGKPYPKDSAFPEKIILNAKGSESLRTHYFFT